MKSKAGIVSVTVLLSSCLVYISFLTLRKDGPMDMRIPFHNGDEHKKQAYRTYEKNEAGCICFHSEDSHTWHHREKNHHNESSC